MFLFKYIYIFVGSWNGIQRVRTLLKDGWIKKALGYNSIQFDKRVHDFTIGDGSYPNIGDI